MQRIYCLLTRRTHNGPRQLGICLSTRHSREGDMDDVVEERKNKQSSVQESSEKYPGMSAPNSL